MNDENLEIVKGEPQDPGYTLERVDISTRNEDLKHMDGFYRQLSRLRRVRYNDGSIGGYTDLPKPVVGLVIEKGAVVLGCEVNLNLTSSFIVGTGVVVANCTLVAKEDGQMTLKQEKPFEKHGKLLSFMSCLIEASPGTQSTISANGDIENSIFVSSSITSEKLSVIDSQIIRSNIKTKSESSNNVLSIKGTYVVDSKLKTTSEKHDVSIFDSNIEDSFIHSDEGNETPFSDAYLNDVEIIQGIHTWDSIAIPARVSIVFNKEKEQHVIRYQSKELGGSLSYKVYVASPEQLPENIRYAIDKTIESYKFGKLI